MLHGTKVENTLFGGPAFGLLKKGDILVKIDGVPVSEDDILSGLRGPDVPGSTVVLTVHRAKLDSDIRRNHITHVPKGNSQSDDPNVSNDEEDLDEIEFTITRIATAEIADRRKMFDHFTSLQVIELIQFCILRYLTADST
jgi:hypothetical protein